MNINWQIGVSNIIYENYTQTGVITTLNVNPVTDSTPQPTGGPSPQPTGGPSPTPPPDPDPQPTRGPGPKPSPEPTPKPTKGPSSKPISNTGGCCHSPEGNFNCNNPCEYLMGGLNKEDCLGLEYGDKSGDGIKATRQGVWCDNIIIMHETPGV